MANGIRTGDPGGFNKGRSSMFREGSRVRQTLKENQRTYRPKRWGNNNKDEDNDKNQQVSSQKLRQLTLSQFRIRVHQLWVRPYSSRSVPNVWFVKNFKLSIMNSTCKINLQNKHLGLIWFHGISTIVFNAKSGLYIYVDIYDYTYM